MKHTRQVTVPNGLAAWFLRLKGFRIVARRYKCPVGEIDLVARRRNLTAFVEVKARKTETAAREAITGAQKVRIRRAAEHFMASRPSMHAGRQQFDAILIVEGRLPIHIRDAWR